MKYLAIEADTHKRGFDFDLMSIERPWHAAEIAEQAVKNGSDIDTV